MHIQTNTTSLYQTTGASPSPGQSSGSGFQAIADSLKQSSNQGIANTASSSLEAQTTSTLLQLQDLSQTQPHGGGSGGHHGGMKMVNNLEAEETAESEETQPSRQRKKFGKTINRDGITETVEVDENNVPLTTNAQQAETNTPEEEKV